MSSISLDTLVLAKKYTDKVLSGLGTLKGSPCILKATKESKLFADFLLSDEAQKIFEEYGFTTIKR